MIRPPTRAIIEAYLSPMPPVDRHLSLVATAFRAAGCVLGLPSIGAFLFLAWVWIGLRPGSPLDAGPTDIQKYGLIGLLNSGAYGVAKAFEFFGGATRWVAGVLAVFSLGATALSAGLFYTGRGLIAHALWARILGALFLLVMLLSSYGGLVSFPRPGAAICALLLGAAAYALWVLGWRFA